MAMVPIPDAMIFGLLSWHLQCHSNKDRSLLWEQQLHDAVLSLAQFTDGASVRVFAGLADGTVAVLEVTGIFEVFFPSHFALLVFLYSHSHRLMCIVFILILVGLQIFSPQTN